MTTTMEKLNTNIEKTQKERKNKNDRNWRRREPAPIWTSGVKANLFLIAPPPPPLVYIVEKALDL
jgi:hypothetical protein